MLRRKDLAKEFSLIVQQEITNHNDKLLATNVALNKFELTLDEFSRCITKEVDKIKSDLGFLSMNRRVDIEENRDAFLQRDDDIRKIERAHDDLLKQFAVDFYEIESALIDKSEITQLEKNIDLYVKEGRAAIKSLSEQIICNEQRFENRLKVLEQKLRSEILDPSNIEKLQSEFNQKLEEHAINNSSLIAEVDVCKKTTFVVEKKFEYLLTKYQRLEKKFEEGKGG